MGVGSVKVLVMILVIIQWRGEMMGQWRYPPTMLT
jgi:hypothetical protein